MTGQPVPLRRNRNFLLLWGGQAISALGSRVSTIAYPLLVLALTGSPADAGVVGFVATLPNVLFQLPAGALVDRWDRKRLMITCDVGRGIVLASIVIALWAGHLTLPHVMIVAFVEGTLSVFFSLAHIGAVRHVVPAQQLPAALAQNEARVRAAGLLGQPLGGVLFGVGRAIPFLVDTISYLASLATLLLIRSEFNEERSAQRHHLVAEIREGISWLWHQPFLRATTLLIAGSNFLFEALVLVLIVIAREQGVSPAAIGVMLGVAGFGGFIGALVAPWLQRLLSTRMVIVGTNWVWALLMLLFTVTPNPYVLAAIFAGMAFVGPVWNVVISAYEVQLTPDRLLGRATSASRLFALGAIPFGSLLGGLLLGEFGSLGATIALSAWMLVLAIMATASRAIRQVPGLPS